MEKLKVTPKDFFLQIAVTLCLYVSVWSILALVFNVIDYAYPDTLQGYVDPYGAGIRFAIASLIIIFPIFLLLASMIRKDYERTPEKQDLWIRKWITYINLFVSGITIAVSLIMILNSFLGGEVTLRFVLKAISTILIAGIIFGYFITDVRKGLAFSRQSRLAYLGGGAVIVLATIIAGFVIMGSPANQRLRRLDDQRVQDLQSIQYQVISYWQQKEKLPQSLAELSNPISGYMLPTDPEGKNYTYEMTGRLAFKLCAYFNLPSTKESTADQSMRYMPAAYGGIGNWIHNTGQTCFDRTIDTELYPPFPKAVTK